MVKIKDKLSTKEYSAIKNEIQAMINIQQTYVIAMYTLFAVFIGLALDYRNPWILLIPYVVLIPFQRIIDAKKAISMKLSAFLSVYADDVWETNYNYFEETVFSPTYKKSYFGKKRIIRVSSLHLGAICSCFCIIRCILNLYKNRGNNTNLVSDSYVPCLVAVLLLVFMYYWCSDALDAYKLRQKYVEALVKEQKNRKHYMAEIQKRMTGYPSIDKPWLKYYTEGDLNLKAPKCTIYQSVYNRNAAYPREVAINYYGNKISYATLFEEVEKCAKTLKSLGVKEGECVTICSAGVPEVVYIMLACSRIKAIANFINPMFTTEQMIERINDTESEWVFVLDKMYICIDKALPETCIKNVVIIPATNSVPILLSKILYYKSLARTILKKESSEIQRYYSWKEFIAIGRNYLGSIDIPYEEDTPAIMVYSSGSTGASKGILLTNDGINATILNYQMSCYPFERGDSFLQMIPIWFSTGNVLSLLMPLVQGITVILEPNFSAKSLLKDLKKYRPSMTLVATSLWIKVINSNEKSSVNLSGMKYPITGGEKVLEQDEICMNRFLNKCGCKVEMIKGYGMCELGSTVSASNNSLYYKGKTGGTGYPILNVIVSAFDIDTNEELKYGEHGEIRVCSPARMKGYYKNPEATKEFFKTDDQGRVWGCTGDIGYVDEDGEVFVLGRATDSAVLDNGKKVFLFNIEEEILKNPNVKQCKVVDIKELGSTKLVAHIVLQDESKDENLILYQLKDTLRCNLPEYEVPYYYKVRESMPVHNNGKRDVDALKRDRDHLKYM